MKVKNLPFTLITGLRTIFKGLFERIRQNMEILEKTAKLLESFLFQLLENLFFYSRPSFEHCK